jgi:hypothetical protein
MLNNQMTEQVKSFNYLGYKITVTNNENLQLEINNYGVHENEDQYVLGCDAVLSSISRTFIQNFS